MIIEMIILIKKLASECSCVPVSSAHIGCCTDYTVTDKCTLDSEDNKQDKTREEADMTLSQLFQKCSKRSKSDPKDGKRSKTLEILIWTTLGHF